MVQVIAKQALDVRKLDFADFYDGKHAVATHETIKFDYPKTHERDRFFGQFNSNAFSRTISGSADIWKHQNYKTGHLFFEFSKMKMSASEVLKAAGTKSTKDDHAIIQNVLAGNDTFIGSKYGDVLYGYGGNDTISGGSGIDWLDGGVGVHDRANYESTHAVVAVTLNAAKYVLVTTDGAAQDHIRNIEDVAGGHASDHLVGDALANGLYGNDGDDVLEGMAGRDSLVGGNGADSLLGGAQNDTLVGGAHNDTLLGGGGDDSLLGGTYDDSLVGGGGKDWLSGDNGNDTVLGGGGNDSVLGGKGNDWLVGGGGADSLDGGKGLDTLIGGGGRDVLTGGADADSFVFLAMADSTTPATGRDFITDFTHKLDKIDLSAIDALTATPDIDDAFVLDKKKGTATSAVAEGHIGWYTVDGPGTANDRTYIRINGDADSAIDMTIELHGVIKISAVDFIL